MKRAKSIQGLVLLVIFTITQLTWAVNSCPTCFARSFNLEQKVSESSSSCCSTKEVPQKERECNTCQDNCRCSSLDTFDDVEAIVASFVTVKAPTELNRMIFTFAIPTNQQFTLFTSALNTRPNWMPPPQYYSGGSHFRTDIIRI